MKLVARLLALTCLLGGCGKEPQKPADLNVWHDERWPYVLIQKDLYEIVAYDVTDGTERWRYRRAQKPPLPHTEPYVPTVTCRPEWTNAQAIIFRFEDAIHAVDAETGELVWERALHRPTGCPTVTPDSGVVLVVGIGDRLRKLSITGETVWEHGYTELSIAIAQPTVVLPSGDTLVRTEKFLVNINPAGERNWVVRTMEAPGEN